MRSSALLSVLMCCLLAASPAQGIPNNPFNQFVDEFYRQSDRVSFSEKLCAQPVWQELAQAAVKGNVVESEDFVRAIHEFYCLEKISDETLLKRLKGVAFVSDTGKATKSRTLARLRKEFGNGTGMGRPAAVWIQVKNGGMVVDIGIDREGGGDDMEMRLVNHHWMFKRIQQGGSC